MKLSKLIALLFMLLLSNQNVKAQKKSLFKQIPIDSLNIITPLVDACKRDANLISVSDPALNKDICEYIIDILKKVLNKSQYTELPRLNIISGKEINYITHLNLAWAKADEFKKLWDAPEITLAKGHKYSLLITITGYYGNSTNNAIFNHLTIIDNHAKKIIYQSSEKILNEEITDKKMLLTSTRKLIDKYMATLPSQPKPL